MGTAALLTKGAQYEGVSTSTIGLLRLALAFLCVGLFSIKPIFKRKYKPSLKTTLTTALAGGFLAIHFLAWMISLEYISISRSTFLVTTSPIWVTLMGATILREKVSRLQITGILIATISSIFILGLGDDTSLKEGNYFLKGELLATLGAISIAAYLIIGRKVRHTIGLQIYVLLTYGFATLTLLFYHLVNSRDLIPSISVDAWICIICLALGPQLVGHTIINWGVRKFHAANVSTFVLAEPIVASALAWLIFNETMGPFSIFGFSGILLGILIVVRQGNH